MPWRNTDTFCSLAPSDLMRAKHIRRPQELSERDSQHSAGVTLKLSALHALAHLICTTSREGLIIRPIQQTRHWSSEA